MVSKSPLSIRPDLLKNLNLNNKTTVFDKAKHNLGGRIRKGEILGVLPKNVREKYENKLSKINSTPWQELFINPKVKLKPIELNKTHISSMVINNREKEEAKDILAKAGLTEEQIAELEQQEQRKFNV